LKLSSKSFGKIGFVEELFKFFVFLGDVISDFVFELLKAFCIFSFISFLISSFEIGHQKELNILTKTFEIKKSFEEEEQILGKLIIVADLDPLYDQIKSNAITTITTETIKMLLIAFLIIFLIKNFVTNRIEELANYAKHLTLDNLDQDFNIEKEKYKENYNELDTVINSLDTMRKNLLEQINKSKQRDHILAHQSKMAAMGEMIGNIAHQWRQPLSLISSSVTGLSLKHQVNILTDDDLVKTLNSINNSTQYLSSTIDDFRNFFMPEKQKEYFYLKETIESTFSLINHQFDLQEIIIHTNINNNKIHGFKNELIQVFINILNNAKDEFQKNNKKEKLIFVSTYTNDKMCIISIKDNAGGIKKTLLNRIFEPYFTTKDKTQGTGIGLYICEEIITKHMDGFITVENVNYTYDNKEYYGAEFKINLPYIKDNDE